jgi:hypothetical protein
MRLERKEITKRLTEDIAFHLPHAADTEGEFLVSVCIGAKSHTSISLIENLNWKL